MFLNVCELFFIFNLFLFEANVWLLICLSLAILCSLKILSSKIFFVIQIYPSNIKRKNFMKKKGSRSRYLFYQYNFLAILAPKTKTKGKSYNALKLITGLTLILFQVKIVPCWKINTGNISEFIQRKSISINITPNTQQWNQ